MRNWERHVRDIRKNEFAGVYEYWMDYTRDRIPVSFFVKDLGHRNTTWTVSVLKHCEGLMWNDE
jgi:hypothetical protein